MKVAIYARVSSEKQAEKDIPITAQLNELRKFSKSKGWAVVKEFVDEAKSARTANRPSFQEMIALAKQKKKAFDVVLVWKLSRFARNRTDSVIYKALLNKHGVKVISIKENIDDSPAGKMFEGIIETMDEFYSANLAQDTMRGMRENARRGYRNGGNAPTGFKLTKVIDKGNKRTKLVIDENFAPIIKRIFQMCLEGMGAKEIVNTFNAEGLQTVTGRKWSKTTVYGILRNEAYTGTYVWNRRSIENGRYKANDDENVMRIRNAHPAIIDLKSFNDAQRILASRSPRRTKPRTINSRYLLSGVLYCGNCGFSMTGASAKSGKFFYYICQNNEKKGKNGCNARLINKGKLEEFIIDRLKLNILTEDNLSELVKLTNEE
ncbi:MAG: recombinase family protein [bacterium]